MLMTLVGGKGLTAPSPSTPPLLSARASTIHVP